MSDFPLRHVSIRVPWHDTGWTGVVCAAPQLNGACAKLKRIAGAKKDQAEMAIAGKRLEDIPQEQWPCCVSERATFMAPYAMDQVKRHALAERDSKNYGHFLPTMQRYPAYSAGIVPFRWLLSDNLDWIRDLYGLDVDISREPNLGYNPNFINEVSNQASVLNRFAAHLCCEDSLCFFYAKHVPFVEGTGRILIGVGRVKGIGSLTEFKRSGEGMRGMLWERPLQHSIRPGGRDGFLLPYYEILRMAADDPDLDLERYTARAPAEHWDEFSYGSELVTHDGAIAALLSMESVLGRMEAELGLATGWQRQWLHDELVRLWQVRGPYPGLGAILRAFGLSRGLFVAHALQQRAGENTDPWPEVDRAFRDPAAILPAELRRDLKELALTWQNLPEQRRRVLRLLSRFELTVDQAGALYDEASREKAGWAVKDADLLQNPYRIYEIGRHSPEGVQLMTVDRGAFPDDAIRLKHPLEAPSGLDSALDARRIRAFAIAALEDAAAAGHTLAFAGSLVEAIRQTAVRPECPVTTDSLTACGPILAPEVVVLCDSGESTFQLDRYREIGELVRRQVLGRVNGQRHSIRKDWACLLEQCFGPGRDGEERQAREEKAAALAELAESRFSVLAGPAGAGKTSVLGILCKQTEIQKEGLLLLAPTGKARVRMQELTGDTGTRAQTIAQFLNQYGRYDGYTGRYHLSDRPKATQYGTVIIDEASMLTEDMFGAVLDALQGVKRLILVGDPAQLPPIGAGRPFVDIIARLKPEEVESGFPRVGPGYAELTIERRQIGTERPDLHLARWFSMAVPSPGEDDVFSIGDNELSPLRFIEWNKPEDFQLKLLNVLAEELSLSGLSDQRGFNRKLGATAQGDYDYFDRTQNGRSGAVREVEVWQILSPLRGMPFGVSDINRQIHERFRSNFIELASRHRHRPIPKPMGAERIVYGDKVINLKNHQRAGKKVYPPEGALGYLANGEIGMVVGQWRTKAMQAPSGILKVEFSSQRGYTYDFSSGDFTEEGEPALELAYALTVHKAQGSQFGLVILVLPEGHPILSRELVYTALTRHQQRVVVMHQGPRALLKDFASPYRSETARRRTNLLNDCRMLELPQAKGSVFLQEGLIHRTSKGLAVRSKSELLIAEALYSAGVGFEYEKPLTFGGTTRYPDFTIEDEISGRTVYWEHLGMLERQDYRAGWEKKKAWYCSNGVHLLSEAKSGAPLLVTTTESMDRGLDMVQVSKLIAEVFSG